MGNFNGIQWIKRVGAIAGSAFFLFALNHISKIAYDVGNPEKPGFLVSIAEANQASPISTPAPSSASSPASVSATKTPDAPKSIAERLASASPEKGKVVAKTCLACHSMDSSNINKVGPGLWNVVERKMGSHPGYTYSSGFKEKTSSVWSYENLDHFLAEPKAFIKGTKMSFPGVKKEDQRADLIAYLRTLSDHPAALPTK